MANDYRVKRLSKIAKEFNVGISTIVDFLRKNGYDIDSKPDNMVTPKQYDLIISEYNDSYIKKVSNITPNIDTKATNKERFDSVLNKQKSKFDTNLNLYTGKALYVEIPEDKTGISYSLLFSEYLQLAERITIYDPYIRYPYQINNMIDFCNEIYNNQLDRVQLRLVTTNRIEERPKTQEQFQRFEKSLEEEGRIEFSYHIRPAKDFHQRKIEINDDIEILLDRGLDIFKRFESLSIEKARQESRKCKSFYVIYIDKRKKNKDV